jgi:DNA-binding beta-propeller fold protein YncE
VLVFDSAGALLSAWERGPIRAPHGIAIGRDDQVIVVDDLGHAVHTFSSTGRLLSTLASQRQPAELEQVRQVLDVTSAGPPFNLPTGAAFGSDGRLYVSDGYGNARVHVFDSSGALCASWGEPGAGSGQFSLPHGVWIDGELVYVSDRMNRRVQLFSLDGEPRGEWPDLRWPNNLCIDQEGYVYVAELGARWLHGRTGEQAQPAARISVRDRAGRMLAGWELDGKRGLFAAPHGIAIDSRGDLYVSEVSFAYTRGAAPPDTPVLRKYGRVGD